jgi:protein-S-isoprenylcysteine O-methyltransferase Ste14
MAVTPGTCTKFKGTEKDQMGNGIAVIDRLRFLIGVFNVVVIPLGVLFWLIIHPWARKWRGLGPALTYLIVLPPLFAMGALLYWERRTLLGADLGAQAGLIALAVLLLAAVGWFELQYWKQLSIATVAGVQELSGTKGKLLRDGIYGMVRHPRYVSAGLGLLSNALFVNYLGLYLLLLLLIPFGSALLMLEERELVERFGDEYRQYQRDVPQLIPRFRKAH